MKTSITLLAAIFLCSSCAAVQPRWQQTDGSLDQTRYYVDVNERADFRIVCSNQRISMSFSDKYGAVRLTAIVMDGQRFEDYDFFSIQLRDKGDIDKFQPLWETLRSAKRITVIADTTPQKSFELPTSNLAKMLPADVTQCDGQQR